MSTPDPPAMLERKKTKLKPGEVDVWQVRQRNAFTAPKPRQFLRIAPNEVEEKYWSGFSRLKGKLAKDGQHEREMDAYYTKRTGLVHLREPRKRAPPKQEWTAKMKIVATPHLQGTIYSLYTTVIITLT